MKGCWKKRIWLAAGAFLVMLAGGCGREDAKTALPVMKNENVELTVAKQGDGADAAGVTETAEPDNEADGTTRDAEAEPPSEIEKEIVSEEPVKVKGIYVTGGIAGHPKMDELIELVNETELNAMVIDVKNDDGRVTYHMDSAQAKAIGADINLIKDIDGLIQKCKEKDIYLIGRVVAFKDPYLAEKKPELSVKTKDGRVFKDKNGLAWVNPYKKEVWDYLIEIASQAAEDGFDEIQFDYIRFSTDLNPDKLDFGADAEGKSRTDVITEFTEYAYDALSLLGVKVAADVYGTVIDNRIDQDIVGQRYKEMAKHLDYICPMVYPSHYGPGNLGLQVPDAEPYETIYRAMNQSKKVLAELPEEKRAGVRVWMQAFTAKWVKGYIPYGKDEIRAQIQGAYDAGYEEWILWNASVNYKREYLLTDKEAEAEAEGWKEERKIWEMTERIEAVKTTAEEVLRRRAEEKWEEQWEEQLKDFEQDS